MKTNNLIIAEKQYKIEDELIIKLSSDIGHYLKNQKPSGRDFVSFTKDLIVKTCQTVYESNMEVDLNELLLSGKRTKVYEIAQKYFIQFKNLTPTIQGQTEIPSVKELNSIHFEDNVIEFRFNNCVCVYKLNDRDYAGRLSLILQNLRKEKSIYRFAIRKIKVGSITLEELISRLYVIENIDLFDLDKPELVAIKLKNSISNSIQKGKETVLAATETLKTNIAEQTIKQESVAEVKKEEVKKVDYNAEYLDLLEQELKHKADFLLKFEEYLDAKSKRLKALNRNIESGE